MSELLKVLISVGLGAVVLVLAFLAFLCFFIGVGVLWREFRRPEAT